MKKILLALLLCFAPLYAQDKPNQPLGNIGVPHITDMSDLIGVTDSVYYLLGAFGSLLVVFGVKKLAEKYAENFLTMAFLKRRGKVAIGLHIKFMHWQGTVTEFSASHVKLELDDSENFVYLNPKMILDGAVEIVVEQKQHKRKSR